jgi:hypothetical protein
MKVISANSLRMALQATARHNAPPAGFSLQVVAFELNLQSPFRSPG